jgi:Annexin
MSLELYPSMVHEGEISRDVASDEIDDLCQKIHDACKGFGTQEKALVTVLGSTTQENRYKIPIRYEQMFEKDLFELIKSECGGKPFGKTLQYLSVNPIVAECEMINQACKGYV